MKKLILITALNICNFSTAMDGNQKIQLGSQQEIEKALIAKDPRFAVLAKDTIIRSAAGRVTTPNGLEHVVSWVRQDYFNNTLHERDVQDATNAIITTSTRVTPKPHHPETTLTTPLAKL
jgi:hypothetical protein